MFQLTPKVAEEMFPLGSWLKFVITIRILCPDYFMTYMYTVYIYSFLFLIRGKVADKYSYTNGHLPFVKSVHGCDSHKLFYLWSSWWRCCTKVHRPKPVQLYGRLLDLYGQTDLCVMDACGANGKCLNYVTYNITMFLLFPSFRGDLLFASVIMKQPHAECHMLLVWTLFMPWPLHVVMMRDSVQCINHSAVKLYFRFSSCGMCYERIWLCSTREECWEVCSHQEQASSAN